jgi:hypothetical protein
MNEAETDGAVPQPARSALGLLDFAITVAAFS